MTFAESTCNLVVWCSLHVRKLRIDVIPVQSHPFTFETWIRPAYSQDFIEMDTFFRIRGAYPIRGALCNHCLRSN